MQLGDIGKILPSELYIVEMSNDVPLSYTNSLTHLYQPLIGMEALTLYQTLYTEAALTEEYQTHHQLMSYISLPLDRLYRARRKLEAIGLLQTFEQEHQGNKAFHYLLHPPLSPERFLNDDFLNHLLYHQLGSEKYKKVQAIFRKHKRTSQEKETTAKFTEVFPFAGESGAPSIESVESRPAIPIDNEVDFEWLEQVLRQRMLPVDTILTKQAKQIINQMYVAYELHNQDIEKALLWAINEENQLQIEEFKQACMDLIPRASSDSSNKVTNQQKVISSASVAKPETKEEQFIDMLEHISPKKLLEDQLDGHQASRQELRMISDIMTNQGLNPGVMNVLIHYVMLKTDMKLSKAYMEKIASHWARKNVKTVRQAMTLAKSENKKYQQWTTNTKSNQRYRQTSPKKDIVPEWYKKQKQQQQPKQTPSTEEKAKTAKEADEMLANYLANQANQE
ncbi:MULTISPECIES: replication initiation and membrane attachment family protein [Gracilibacillus]|uniref:replication initiation and membrane attachment family protein n=1 Tax=Gracilibacillus TaxID=74385 RepID=UPI0008249AC7|nr:MULTISPECIES: DnaD domain protein [Gracilibacillus]